ncbi:hypothetical protein ES676_04850 [Bizionia saleffrena]|uniref:Lipoprotein n=1 Tax=Bizionia saleffrena TaxID=291189 RepID=A0A8H2QM38_9FLAO|nr:hypothetical protein [Bizionia saleffrena]TYB76677.1 hypothetical protein ES676_04850 [Bizionia saleffrena]
MKHFIFTMSLLAIVSCKDSKTVDENLKTEAIEQTVEATNDHNDHEMTNAYAEAWSNDIELNNGNKWQANFETNDGVERMKESIKTQSTNSLEDYKTLAKQLSDDKNYVVKNCTMTGASHDNLHIWLLPLMAKIDALSEAKTTKEASQLKHSIEQNVNAYNTYFQ